MTYKEAMIITLEYFLDNYTHSKASIIDNKVMVTLPNIPSTNEALYAYLDATTWVLQNLKFCIASHTLGEIAVIKDKLISNIQTEIERIKQDL